jgi:hypothetical protein
MLRRTRLDARHLSKPTAARGQGRLHASGGVMHLGSIGRLGRYTATPLEPIAAVSLELQISKPTRATASPVSGRSATRHKHGSHSVSLLAVKPVAASRHTSDPNLGGGARLVQATREERPINSTTTEEVER